jgi:hypothetical protein
MERDISTAGVLLLTKETAQLMMPDNDGQRRRIFGVPGVYLNNYNTSDD